VVHRSAALKSIKSVNGQPINANNLDLAYEADHGQLKAVPSNMQRRQIPHKMGANLQKIIENRTIYRPRGRRRRATFCIAPPQRFWLSDAFKRVKIPGIENFLRSI
jgi:hypothetical protein